MKVLLRRENIVGKWLLAGALLLASCTGDEVTEVTPTGLPVTFYCEIEGTDTSENGYVGSGMGGYVDDGVSRASGDDPARELLTMRNTGFSVSASHNAATTLNFMYNQEVTYAAPHYPRVPEHWEYTPLKFWPAPVGTLHFHAFAPYASAATTDTGQNGIVGVAATTGSSPAPRLTYRLATDKVGNVVNLLYTTQDVTTTDLQLRFKHALARLGIQMRTASPLVGDTRILLKSLTLTSNTTTPIAKKGTFTLGSTPTWTVTADDKETSRTYTISNDRESSTAYAYVNSDLCYVDALPAKWQSAQGLPCTDASDAPVYAPVVTLGDYVSYIYLIPQESLTLTCTVNYYECTPSTNTLSAIKTKTFFVELRDGSGDDPATEDYALKVGRTINLKLTLTP